MKSDTGGQYMHVKNSNDSTANVRFLHGKHGIRKLGISFILLFETHDAFEALFAIKLTVFEIDFTVLGD